MEWNRFFKFKKFMNRIFIWVTLAFLALLIVFSSIVYYNTERIVRQNEYETNKKIMYQLKYNIEFMDSTLKNLCSNLFINKDVSSLMYDNDIIILDVYYRLSNIESIIIANPFVHSVYIYNGNTKEFYSSRGIITDNKEYFGNIARKKGIIPVLKPLIPGKGIGIEKTKEDRNILTYLMYEYTDAENIPKGALIVNVKTEWIIDNLLKMNMIEKKPEDIFILNEEGEFISTEEGNDDLKERLKDLSLEYLKGSGLKDGNDFISRIINGKDYIVTFLNVEKANLVLIKIQPFDEVFMIIKSLRISLIFITLICILFAAIVSFSVSKKIYKPFGNLVSHINTGILKDSEKKDFKDEISYLEEIYRLSEKKIKNYEIERTLKKSIVKEFYIKKLLTQASSLNETETDDEFVENNINLRKDEGFAVCLLKLDNYREFQSKYGIDDRKLIKFDVINFLLSALSAYNAESIDMDEDRIAVIINTKALNDRGGDFYDKLGEIIKQVQEHILNYFKVTVSITFSEATTDIRELSALYNSVLNDSMYRIVYGKMSLISPDMVRANNENKCHEISFDLDKKLSEGIMAGNLKAVENYLEKATKEISEFSYKNIIISIIVIIDTIEKIVNEINRVSLEPLYMDLKRQSIFEIETLDEFYALVVDQLKQLMKRNENRKMTEKQTIIVENVKEIINRDYFSSSICLIEIAALLKLSPGYLGKVFKMLAKMPVNEYINEVRLNKAKDWLEKSNLSVSEIFTKVGIENETYFYSLFKKKYGITPREYALQKNLKKS